jgi:hypothetical protein
MCCTTRTHYWGTVLKHDMGMEPLQILHALLRAARFSHGAADQTANLDTCTGESQLLQSSFTGVHGI